MKELIVKVKNLVIGFSLSEEKSITIRTDIRKHGESNVVAQASSIWLHFNNIAETFVSTYNWWQSASAALWASTLCNGPLSSAPSPCIFTFSRCLRTVIYQRTQIPHSLAHLTPSIGSRLHLSKLGKKKQTDSAEYQVNLCTPAEIPEEESQHVYSTPLITPRMTAKLNWRRRGSNPHCFAFHFLSSIRPVYRHL